MCLTSLLDSALHTAFQKKNFHFHAGSQLNVSHIINPSNIADPKTSWRKREPWPRSRHWGLQGHPCAPLPQRPPGHTLELSTRSFCTFSLMSKTFHHTRFIPLFIHWGLQKRVSQRLGFPQGQTERSSCDCSLSQAAQNGLAAISTALLAQSCAVAPGSQQAGYVPRHAVLSAPP